MSCDHDTLTDLYLDDPKYILVYCGNKIIDAVFVKNKVTSMHQVEEFNTAQETFDRTPELGLIYTTEQLIKFMEHGATLPPDIESMLLGYVWEDEYMRYWERMEALGYEKPEPELNLEQEV